MRRALLVALVVAFAGAGCATSQEVADLTRRLDQIEGQLRAIDERVQSALTVATRAERLAAAAQGEAEAAEQRADVAARKAEQIFEKSVSK